jgi:hypothetical protein
MCLRRRPTTRFSTRRTRLLVVLPLREKKDSTDLWPSNSQRRFAIWAFVVSILAATVTAIPSWISKISIEPSKEPSIGNHVPLSDYDPIWLVLPREFTVKNESSFALHDVRVSCVFLHVEYPNRGIVNDFGTSGFNRIADELQADATATAQCPSIAKLMNIRDSRPIELWLAVVVRYRTGWLLTKTRSRKFACGGKYPATCVRAPLF